MKHLLAPFALAGFLGFATPVMAQAPRPENLPSFVCRLWPTDPSLCL
jgi:hypothetical protein